MAAAAGLAPAGGLPPRCYVTLFGLITATGLRISEALALRCVDVDLGDAVLTVRAGKRGRTRLVAAASQRRANTGRLRRRTSTPLRAAGQDRSVLPHRSQRPDQLQHRAPRVQHVTQAAGLERDHRSSPGLGAEPSRHGRLDGSRRLLPLNRLFESGALDTTRRCGSCSRFCWVAGATCVS